MIIIAVKLLIVILLMNCDSYSFRRVSFANVPVVESSPTTPEVSLINQIAHIHRNNFRYDKQGGEALHKVLCCLNVAKMKGVANHLEYSLCRNLYGPVISSPRFLYCRRVVIPLQGGNKERLKSE